MSKTDFALRLCVFVSCPATENVFKCIVPASDFQDISLPNFEYPYICSSGKVSEFCWQTTNPIKGSSQGIEPLTSLQFKKKKQQAFTHSRAVTPHFWLIIRLVTSSLCDISEVQIQTFWRRVTSVLQMISVTPNFLLQNQVFN